MGIQRRTDDLRPTGDQINRCKALRRHNGLQKGLDQFGQRFGTGFFHENSLDPSHHAQGDPFNHK